MLRKKKHNISIPLFGYAILCGFWWVQPLISNLVFELSVLTLTLAHGATPRARRHLGSVHVVTGRQGKVSNLKFIALLGKSLTVSLGVHLSI